MPMVLLALAVALALGLGTFALMRDGAPAPAAPASNAFNFASVSVPTPSQSPTSSAPAEDPTASPKDRLFSGLGLSGAGPAAGSEAKLTREKQFLARNDGAVLAYQQRLNEIGMRYYKKYPVVRQVDSDFASLPRYMAVMRRYQADRDAYQWARDTAALPEVRDTIKKYLARPEAWGVAADMALDALKQRPPPALYQEVARVVTEEPAVRELVKNVEADVQPNLTVGVMALAGKDLTPLQGVIKDLSLDKKTSP
jgi:hypothetical protein